MIYKLNTTCMLFFPRFHFLLKFLKSLFLPPVSLKMQGDEYQPGVSFQGSQQKSNQVQ